jgi:1,4-alpha-glucan branching enzyme
MGANLIDGSCSFRVWAPNADRVSVAGTFNHWSADAHPLARENGGFWSADVTGAKYRDEYKFVIRFGSKAHWRNDPYARETTQSNGNSVIIDPSFEWGDENEYRTPPWHELVIYELHIGTFNDRPGGPTGNFDTAIEKLDYLAHDLSINAVHIMPPYDFPGASSWGYNPAHLFAVERDYGGPKALRRFVRAAHERGIAVIFDVVYNHFGPSDLDLWRFDGWSQASHEGGIYFYDNHRRPTPWGPRPDYGRGEVRQFIRDNALHWLTEFRADGLRFDATAYIRTSDSGDLPDGWGLLQWINNEIDARMPWKLTIAEDLRNNEWITKTTGGGGAGFDSQWDAQFVHPIRRAVITREDKDRNMSEVAHAIGHCYNGNPIERVIYTESHDEVANGHSRVPEEIWPGKADSWFSKKRSTLGAAVTFTSPGIPLLFQGQEFLEDRWFHDDDPIEWHRRDKFAGIVRLYGDLIRLRRNWHNNTRGLRGPHVNIFHVNHWDKVIAYHRWDQGGPGDDVVVVANFSARTLHDYTIGLPRGGWWSLRLNSDAQSYDRDFGACHVGDVWAGDWDRDGLNHSGSLSLPPYTALVFSQT